MATKQQVQHKNAERYVKAMLKNIKVRGEQPITKTDNGVVVSAVYGGGTFEDEVAAYVHIYKYLFYCTGVRSSKDKAV